METLDAYDIPDLLANLVERSLVFCDPATGRHHMSESMRVYSAEQLGDDHEMRHRHFRYFLGYADRMFEHNRVHEDAKAQALFQPEIDNFRQAFEWSMTQDPVAGLHLISCTGPSWMRGLRAEAELLFTRALAATPEGPNFDRISARMQLARGKLRQGFPAEAEQLLTIAQLQMEAMPEEDVILRTGLLITRSFLEIYTEQRQAARKSAGEALELAKEHSLLFYQSAANVNLGECCRGDGDLEAASNYYQQALALSHGDPFGDAVLHFNIGSTYLEMDIRNQANPCDSSQWTNLASAEQNFRQSLDRFLTGGDILAASGALGGIGFICVIRGRYEEAGFLMGVPEARRRRNGNKMDPVDAKLFSYFRDLGESLGGEIFTTAFSAGGTLTAEEVSDLIKRTRLD